MSSENARAHIQPSWIACVGIGFICGLLVGDSSSDSNSEEAAARFEFAGRSAASAPPSAGHGFAKAVHQIPVRTPGVENENEENFAGEPMTKRTAKQFIEEFVRNEDINRERIYGPLFMDLGLGAEASEELLEAMSEIMRNSVTVENSLRDLYETKQAYVKKIEDALEGDAHQRYVDFEENKHARTELDKLNTYLESAGRDLFTDEENARLITDLIRESEAYAEPTWHGPFDEAPRPLVGARMIANEFERALPEFEERFNVLIRNADSAGLSKSGIESLRMYYQNAIDDKQRVIDQMRRIEEERIRDPNAAHYEAAEPNVAAP